MACGILVPQPGIEPAPPAVEARRPNHWTTREVPKESCLKYQQYHNQQLFTGISFPTVFSSTTRYTSL